MSIESRTMNLLVNDTTRLVTQAFVEPESVAWPRFSTGSNDDIENRYSLGTVVLEGDDLLVRLGADEMDYYYEELSVDDDQIDAVATYVGLSIYAGTLIAMNILINQENSPELRSAFDTEMRDQSSLLMALHLRETVELKDEDHQLAVRIAMDKLVEQDNKREKYSSIIETANIQRIGAGVVCEVARQGSFDEITSAASCIVESLDDSIATAQRNSKMLGSATGNSTNHLASFYQGFIGMKGFGYTIPASRDEIIVLRKKLIHASRTDEQLASVSTLFDEMSDDTSTIEDTFDGHRDHGFTEPGLRIVE